MKRILSKIFERSRLDESLINELINKQNEVKKLPELSDVERFKFEQDLAIDHLINSSRIEGVHLESTKLSRIINASR